MKTWYRKISREPDELQGYLPRFNTEEREEPRPQTVASPIIDSIETSEEEPRAEKESKPTYTTSTNTTSSSFKSKNEFKATMLPIYKRILSQMGLNTAYAKALVAQDGLESAWGTKPSGKFNFGGIKGKGSVKRTREVINGKDVYINDSFRDFDSLEDYAKYKISLLNNRYKAFTGDISGFADRVFRGGYATDPKYADTLKRVIASAKHGGILKFQAGGTGEIRPDRLRRKWDNVDRANSAPADVIAGFTPYDYSATGDKDSARLAVLPGADTRKWVDNWLSQRKDKLKNNSIYSGWLAIPGLIENPYFRQSASSFKRGKLPGKITGLTNHKEKTITTSDDKFMNELMHLDLMNRLPKLKKLLIDEDYLDKPSEIYSRLMELRFNNNLDPNHEYTLEEVQELRNKNHTGDYLIRFYKSNINNPTIIEPIDMKGLKNFSKGLMILLYRDY